MSVFFDGGGGRHPFKNIIWDYATMYIENAR